MSGPVEREFASGEDERSCRSLVNMDGQSFALEIGTLTSMLGALDNPIREQFRDKNARDIAQHDADRMLIVAGPGTGKSFLFMARIQHWLPLYPNSSVYVSSFVRKLVRDLQSDVERVIPDDQKHRVTVSTLHALAWSIIETAHGSTAKPYRPNVQVISGNWIGVVWSDVLQFHASLNARTYSHEAYDHQLHTAKLEGDVDWVAVRATYSQLSQFYNALGFADLIILAREIVDEKPEINKHGFWIIDEFQDFNTAETRLIQSLTEAAVGVLIAGDDDQALYQKLKASIPEIIISYYADERYANAMLPYCSRCSFHVCLAASSFIAQDRTPSGIEKVYLPLKIDPDAPMVQVIATIAPVSAVDYIEKFIHDHQDELNVHITKMENGEETDPFLLILTPEKKARFFKTNDADKILLSFLSQWSKIDAGRSSDYLMVLAFCRVALDLADNFAFRKVLDHEGFDAAKVHDFLDYAMAHGCQLAAVPDVVISALVAKCRDVLRIATDADLTPSNKAGCLSALIKFSAAKVLTQELEKYPIGLPLWRLDNEAEEAIQTAGVLAPVEMMSIVGSKGLSAHHVIIIGCDDVNLEKTSHLAFFVGLTRARLSLHLIVSMKAGGSTTAHRFVIALPSDHCEYIIYKKTGRVSEQLANSSQFEGRIGQWQRMSRRRT